MEGIGKETAVKSDYAVTKKYKRVVKEVKKNVESKNPGEKETEDSVQGLIINKEKVSATAKKFKRKVVKTDGYNGITRIIGDDGKTVVYEGKNTSASTKKALADSEKHENDTNQRRDKNEKFFNLTSGAKKDLTITDFEKLKAIGSARKI